MQGHDHDTRSQYAVCEDGLNLDVNENVAHTEELDGDFDFDGYDDVMVLDGWVRLTQHVPKSVKKCAYTWQLALTRYRSDRAGAIGVVVR